MDHRYALTLECALLHAVQRSVRPMSPAGLQHSRCHLHRSESSHLVGKTRATRSSLAVERVPIPIVPTLEPYLHITIVVNISDYKCER